jgi:adenylate cyclase
LAVTGWSHADSAPTSHPHDMAPQELHTFLFADIAGYSLLTELDGDEAAADLAMRFVSDASSIARDHGAEVVKGLGDAVMVHADNADRAVRLALDLLTELGRDQLMLPIHAGLHTGPAVGRLGDWWGATVNIAARVAAAAGPGQILLTEATRAAAGEMDSIRLRELGPLRLKNITLPVKIYAASRVPLARWVAPPRRAPSVFVSDVAGRSRRVAGA